VHGSRRGRLTILVQIHCLDGFSRHVGGLRRGRRRTVHRVDINFERRHEGFVQVIIESLQILRSADFACIRRIE